jgi:hypothetical protein
LKTFIDQKPMEISPKLMKKLTFVGFGLTSDDLWLMEGSVILVVGLINSI